DLLTSLTSDHLAQKISADLPNHAIGHRLAPDERAARFGAEPGLDPRRGSFLDLPSTSYPAEVERSPGRQGLVQSPHKIARLPRILPGPANRPGHRTSGESRESVRAKPRERRR